MPFAVYVTVGRTNKNRAIVADQARRLVDYIGGREGFSAKANATDKTFKDTGFHRLVFKTRGTAKKYQMYVDTYGDPSVHTRRTIIRKKVRMA